jgi:23S rRNA-/tRNA-specific pseudouridylate synthase
LLVARNAEYAAHLSELIQSREVQKEYLARVLGKFPEYVMRVRHGQQLTRGRGEVVCDKPIEKPNFKDARCRVCATGQSAVTRFERIAYDGHTSLVRCMPLTGRNHQIRVHLLHLGHPIANDPIYASAPPAPAAAALPATEPAITSEFVRADVKPLEIKCAVCETTVEIHDTQHMLIWLHALSYRISPTEVYSVPPPAWASADATYPLYAPATGLSDKLPLPK